MTRSGDRALALFDIQLRDRSTMFSTDDREVAAFEVVDAVCEGAMTRQQLQGALALKSEENFRQRYLMPALAAGLIEMTIPDKPTSRLQRYRLTAQGKALLARRSKP